MLSLVNLLERAIIAETQTGTKTITNARVSEMSQLGMSVFIDRAPGIILPGDKISGIEIHQNETLVFKGEGRVNRIDLNNATPEISDSYEAVILFTKPARDKIASDGKREIVGRAGTRHPILDDKPCYFKIKHPLFNDQELQGKVFEISTSGLSCLFEKTPFPVVEGLNFADCTLQMPFQATESLSFKVAHVEYRSDGEQTRLRIGGEFISTPVSLLKNISEYAQTLEKNYVEDLKQSDLDQLWEFMFETNFIYENKRKQIQNSSSEILQTYKKLMKSDNPLVKKVVYKEDNEIKGHLSALRFYDQSWLIQHLNADKSSSGSAAQKVLFNMIEFLKDAKAHAKSDLHYMLSFYRPNNIYPAILFGKGAELINDPSKAATFDFAFGLYKNNEKDLTDSDLTIQCNEQSCMNGLVNTLLEMKMVTFLTAIGLSSQNPADLKVRSEFQKIGLDRKRSIYSIEGVRSKIYAIAESSSPGLNLSELTNCVYLFTNQVDEEESSLLSEKLLQHIYSEVYEPMGVIPTVMQPKNSFKTNAVEWSKNYTCLVMNVNVMTEFETIATDIVSNFKTYLKEALGQSASEVKSRGRRSA